MGNRTFFEGIRDAVDEAIRDLRAGRPMVVHVLEWPDPPRPLSPKQIIAIRDKVGVAQGVFAQLVNVSSRTLRGWESGRTKPSGIALRFLRVIEKHPEVLGYSRRKTTTTALAAERRKQRHGVRARRSARKAGGGV